MKISDCIVDNPTCGDGSISYSIEFFPPKTEKGQDLLRKRMPTFLSLEGPPSKRPRFIDITWGAGGSTSLKTLAWVNEWTKLYPNIPINLHITCTNMSQELLDSTLDKARAIGIQNLVALRGDPPQSDDRQDVPDTPDVPDPNNSSFRYGVDLVRYLRSQESGSHKWHLTVGGYPEGHPEAILDLPAEFPRETLSPSERLRAITKPDGTISVCPDKAWKLEIKHLATKVHAGADMIITQLFFDPEIFLQFLSAAREEGITCPILPGIMLIQDYAGFHRMTGFCRTKVPQWILKGLETVRDDPIGVREFGTHVALEMIKQLSRAGIRHFHFYTLNRPEVLGDVINRMQSADGLQNVNT